MINAVIIVGCLFFFLVVAGLFLYSLLSWNIPITVLRFMGNKQRPLVLHKKGRKKMMRGVPHLQVRGYKQTIRDFKSDYYWPALKSKYGALILWEFEDGWLTPTVPKKRKLTTEEEQRYESALAVINEIGGVRFEYDPVIHHELRLKVVDDVDMEFQVEQQARQEGQYTAGFWGFMEKYGTHMLILMIVVCLLVGFIVYLKNAPNLGAQCLSQLEEVAKQGWLERAAGMAPGG